MPSPTEDEWEEWENCKYCGWNYRSLQSHACNGLFTELLDALQDVVMEYGTLEDGTILSMGSSAMAEAMTILAKWNRMEIIEKYNPRLIRGRIKQ